MASWLPLVRLLVPHLAEIVTAAAPAFTSKSAGKDAERLMAQQIAELQHAARTNAESIKVVAGQLQRTAQAIDDASAATQKELRLLQVWAYAATMVALLALVVAIAAIWVR